MFKSIMVSVDQSNALVGRVKIAVDLANRFEARLIGVGAHGFIPFVSDAGATEVIEQQRACVEEELRDVEHRFRRLTDGQSNVACRFAVELPNTYLRRNARASDLVVIGGKCLQHGPMNIDPGDAVMTAGKPILMIPPNISSMTARKVIVAWNDTVESRRAVHDCLPFLTQAEDICVASFGQDVSSEGCTDVADYLKFRGLNVHISVRRATLNGVAQDLFALAELKSADLIVAGAYGHSRMHEWIFGGVTQDLIENSSVPCLLTH